MNRLEIDPEEMALRRDRDFIDSLKMIGEGGSSFSPFNRDDDDEGEVEDKELPRAYQ